MRQHTWFDILSLPSCLGSEERRRRRKKETRRKKVSLV
jgi:hypothetical protein